MFKKQSKFQALKRIGLLPNLLCIQLIIFTAKLCPELAPISNGAITYGPDMTAPFEVDTVATHSCNDGFILGVGSETRMCLNTGIWSGLIPVCRGTYYRFII